ncbi:MAG: ral nucleoside transport system ATP-binding protein [Chloroflexia bacterium]|jgi:simple sugar transport system ATP-binding protein|nr:ral nucleoside transport system ATP-binding protein [Chloroflexia bacterium]
MQTIAPETQLPAPSAEYALQARGITKRFPGVLANDHIDLDLRPGEVHALLGENGAGKSTLMNILYGLYRSDEGAIYIKGKETRFTRPSHAIAAGIGMVHQHFMLVPPLTVTENIMLGGETTQAGVVLDKDAAAKRIQELSSTYGLHVDPNAKIEDLPVGSQQRVEILKAFYRNAAILILDEPTAVLTPQEARDLFVIMRRLAESGKAIVFITHKLKEVLAIADRITVLRHGRVAGTADPHNSTEAQLASLMVGRTVLLQVEKKPSHVGEAVLTIEGLGVKDNRGQMAVDGLDMQVRSGEIFGIAGIEGNGQTELVEALTGLRKVHHGKITLDDRDVTLTGTRQLIDSGLAHVPEDRHKHGLVLTYSVADNICLSTYDERPFARGPLRMDNFVFDFARKLVKKFDVRTASVQTQARNLSGGNQQKAILARELSRQIRLLVASQPTRGLDVGSIEFIHKQIVAQRDEGVAVLLVSAELDEVMALSDTIGVIYKGKLVATMPRAEATREKLGLLMTGGTVPA